MKSKIMFICLLFSSFSLHADIQHLVLLWLKPEANNSVKQNIIDQTQALDQLTDVESIWVGASIPNPRPIADDSFDIGVTMLFKDKNALDRFLKSEKHSNFVKFHIKPYINKILVYDFEVKTK
ncbi:Dabb family protein [Catenovulum maritimum]|uniref:Stress-response A/B barrel domain-containing protein n=1 Tax=Catenovulum maritimum TaxID=1513271 RepID=A0A0J8GYC7_9ALTE|nr:Dabb family protein [Catenovulum maritimum]KMT65733.1 hypothetical protein XM47_06890 [Catenovulum maritimum]